MDTSFEEILEICLTAIIEGKMDVQECLARYPEFREKLSPLLHTATQLKTGKDLRIACSFRSLSQERMIQHFHKIGKQSAKSTNPSYPTLLQKSTYINTAYPLESPKIKKSTFRQTSWLPALAVIFLVLIVLTSNVIGASASSLPGDVFYPVKRSVETIQLSTASSEVALNRLHLDFAGRRLDEAEELIHLNRETDSSGILSDYAEHLNYVSKFLSEKNIGVVSEEIEFTGLALISMQNQHRRLQSLENLVSENTQVLIKIAEQKASVGLYLAQQILARYPEIVKDIPGTLIAPTSIGLSGSTLPQMSTSSVLPGQPTTTMTASWIYNPTEVATIIGGDPLQWLTATPNNPRISTIWPTIYPTLVDIATRIQEITATPRPLLKPTRVRPTTIPTNLVIPTRPPGH